jgi:hypothetical protein
MVGKKPQEEGRRLEEVEAAAATSKLELMQCEGAEKCKQSANAGHINVENA